MAAKKVNVRNWKVLKRHELCAEYKDIAGPAWDRFLNDFRQVGNVTERRIVLHEGKILDGAQLHRAHVECDVKPEFVALPKHVSPTQFVRILNDNRRHEDESVIAIRNAAREERVVEKRQAGESLRSIAESEGVSPSTVKKDLEKAEAKGKDTAPKGGKVKGKDKREHSPKKKESGKVLFTWKDYRSSLGTLVRQLDVMSKPFGESNSDEANELRERINKWDQDVQAWHRELVRVGVRRE